jgi:hypothetical protein
MFDVLGCVGTSAFSAAGLANQLSQQQQYNQYQQQQSAYNQGMQNAYNQLGVNYHYGTNSWQQTFQPVIPTMQDDITHIVNSIFARDKRWRQAEPIIACNEQRADEYETKFHLVEDEYWQKCRMESRLRKVVE